jgi:cardiolipin synthase
LQPKGVVWASGEVIPGDHRFEFEAVQRATNLDWRSFLHNDEVNAVILGQGFGAQMQAMFEKDLASSNPITLEQWNQRSIGMRLKESAARFWQRAL